MITPKEEIVEVVKAILRLIVMVALLPILLPGLAAVGLLRLIGCRIRVVIG